MLDGSESGGRLEDTPSRSTLDPLDGIVCIVDQQILCCEFVVWPVLFKAPN